MFDEERVPVEPDPPPDDVRDSTSPEYADRILEARKLAETRAAEARAAGERERRTGIFALVPVHNRNAVIGYYCAIVALLPCFPVALLALWFGYRGLRAVREDPSVGGRAHAWIGVVAGGFFSLLWGGVWALMALSFLI